MAQKAELRRQLFYSVRRLDVLQELLEDAGITEIMVNGYQHIFVERNGRIERYGKSFTSAEKLEDVIQQIVGRCNRVVNEQKSDCGCTAGKWRPRQRCHETGRIKRTDSDHPPLSGAGGDDGISGLPSGVLQKRRQSFCRPSSGPATA